MAPTCRPIAAPKRKRCSMRKLLLGRRPERTSSTSTTKRAGRFYLTAKCSLWMLTSLPTTRLEQTRRFTTLRQARGRAPAARPSSSGILRRRAVEKTLLLKKSVQRFFALTALCSTPDRTLAQILRRRRVSPPATRPSTIPSPEIGRLARICPAETILPTVQPRSKSTARLSCLQAPALGTLLPPFLNGTEKS